MPDDRDDIDEADNAASTQPADSVAGQQSDIPNAANDRPPAHWIKPHSYQQQLLLGNSHADIHRADSLGNHWSVPWSDLMMVMFILFAALVTAQAMQNKVPEYIDRDRPVTVEKDKIARENTHSSAPNFEPLMRINVLEKSRQAVREANIENVEIVLLDDQSVKVSVQGPMFFDRGADELRPDVRTFLNTLATVIRQTDYKVNVIGHTDDRPINNERFASNWELSLMRAAQVAKHLIDEGGIEPVRFTVMGRSQYDPVKPNDDNANRSLNRRVEIIITRELSQTVEDRS